MTISEKKPYSVIHLDIDGAIRQDRGYLNLHVEIHPIGTELPKSEQKYELWLQVGSINTILNQEGLSQLARFLHKYEKVKNL